MAFALTGLHLFVLVLVALMQLLRWTRIARLDASISTITTQDHHHQVTSNLVKSRGTSREGAPADDPLHTVSAGGTHPAEVRARRCTRSRRAIASA